MEQAAVTRVGSVMRGPFRYVTQTSRMNNESDWRRRGERRRRRQVCDRAVTEDAGQSKLYLTQRRLNLI